MRNKRKEYEKVFSDNERSMLRVINKELINSRKESAEKLKETAAYRRAIYFQSVNHKTPLAMSERKDKLGVVEVIKDFFTRKPERPSLGEIGYIADSASAPDSGKPDAKDIPQFTSLYEAPVTLGITASKEAVALFKSRILGSNFIYKKIPLPVRLVHGEPLYLEYATEADIDTKDKTIIHPRKELIGRVKEVVVNDAESLYLGEMGLELTTESLPGDESGTEGTQQEGLALLVKRPAVKTEYQ